MSPVILKQIDIGELLKSNHKVAAHYIFKGLNFVAILAKEAGDSKNSFLQQVNRGGLLEPSDVVYVTSSHCWQLFKTIMDNEQHKETFLSYSNPRRAFIMLHHKLLAEGDDTKPITLTKCQAGHKYDEYIDTITVTFFNTMSKNFIRQHNDAIHADRKRKSCTDKNSKCSKKISKLSSEKI